MPCTSCTTSPCRTGLGGLLTSSWCLGKREPHVTLSCRGLWVLPVGQFGMCSHPTSLSLVRGEFVQTAMLLNSFLKPMATFQASKHVGRAVLPTNTAVPLRTPPLTQTGSVPARGRYSGPLAPTRGWVLSTAEHRPPRHCSRCKPTP